MFIVFTTYLQHIHNLSAFNFTIFEMKYVNDFVENNSKKIKNSLHVKYEIKKKKEYNNFWDPLRLMTASSTLHVDVLVTLF